MIQDNSFICGNYLDVLKQFDRTADLCLTDPPYGIFSKEGGVEKEKH